MSHTRPVLKLHIVADLEARNVDRGVSQESNCGYVTSYDLLIGSS